MELNIVDTLCVGVQSYSLNMDKSRC